MKISYCPTMTPYIEKISSEIEGIKLLPASSAAEALYLLQTKYAQGIIIGRVAKKSEIPDEIFAYRLKDGKTLIYRQKVVVNIKNLKHVDVYTYLSRNSLKDVEILFRSVTFFDTLDECLRDDLETPVLVDWQDYRDEFELLIPVNESGKIPYFRAPIFYYYRDTTTKKVLEKMKKAIEKTGMSR